jgi:hypothetical protein
MFQLRSDGPEISSHVERIHMRPATKFADLQLLLLGTKMATPPVVVEQKVRSTIFSFAPTY